MLITLLGNLLYLDGYKSLWEKYHDTCRERYRTERHWAIDNYRRYFNRALHERDFNTCIALRKAKADRDYIAMHNIMVDMDGELEMLIKQ